MDDDTEYHFVACDIKWNIENFCLAYPDPYFCISSREFFLQGFKSLKWRITLQTEKDELSENNSPDNSLVSVFLEMTPNSEATNICIKEKAAKISVNWEITLNAGTESLGPKEGIDVFGEHNKHGWTGIATKSEILSLLTPFIPDTLVIRLFFVAFDQDKPFRPVDEDKNSREIIALYEDLKQLKTMEKNYADTKLKVKDEYIPAHKVILGCYERFGLYIEEAKNNNEIEIEGFDYKTIDDFVNFLYSGNINDYLKDPSISKIRCTKHFKCNALKPYYFMEEMIINSKIKAETHEYEWQVEDLLEKSDFSMRSPFIERFHSNIKWQLIISLDSNDPLNYISVFAEIIQGEMPMLLCLEFALKNASGGIHFPRRLIRHAPNYAELGFRNFVKKSQITDDPSLTLNDSVRFVFRSKISDGSKENLMNESHIMSFTSPCKVRLHDTLTKNLTEFFTQEIFSDVTIKSKEKTKIKAHKCILAARSPLFKKKIESESSSSKKSIKIKDVEYDILNHCIKYMYMASLKDVSRGEVKSLLDVSQKHKLDIPSLHEECTRYLRENR